CSSTNWSLRQITEPQYECLFCKAESLRFQQNAVSKPLNQSSEFRNVIHDAVTCLDYLVGLQAAVTKPNGLKVFVGYDESVTTQSSIDANPHNISAPRIMRVRQDEFRIPFVECLHLLRSAKTQQVLLKSQTPLRSRALLLNVHRHPMLFTQSGQD